MINMAKKPPIKKAILKTLAQKPVLAMDFVKKGTREALVGTEDRTQAPTESGKVDYAITRSLKNLITSGLVEVFNSDRDQYFRLTPLGKQQLQNMALEGESSLVSTIWDGHWRIILLDIPEDRKNERESLRYLLKKAGFVLLKNSAWVSPYPFEHMFMNIKKDLGLTTEMIIIVSASLDDTTAQELRKTFGV